MSPGQFAALEQSLTTAAMLLPAAVWMMHRRRPRTRAMWLFLGCTLVVYGIMLSHAQVVGMRLEAELYAFDLDGDGAFSAAEVSADQERALARWAQDTGRNLAPLTGVFVSPIVVLIGFGIADGVRWLRRRVLPSLG